MVEFEAHTFIHKPVEIVVRAFLNPENMLYYTTDLVKYEVISGGADIAGSVMHLYYKNKGRTYKMEDTLEFCEPGKKYISTVSGEALKARVEINFTAEQGGTLMSLSWSGKGKVIFLKFFLRLLLGKIKRQALAELEKFAEMVETTGVDFSERNNTKS